MIGINNYQTFVHYVSIMCTIYNNDHPTKVFTDPYSTVIGISIHMFVWMLYWTPPSQKKENIYELLFRNRLVYPSIFCKVQVIVVLRLWNFQPSIIHSSDFCGLLGSMSESHYMANVIVLQSASPRPFITRCRFKIYIHNMKV